MIPSRRISNAMRVGLKARARLLVPLEKAIGRLKIASSSGAKRTENLAEFAWRSGDGLAAVELWRDLEQQQPRKAAWPLNIAKVAKERGDIEGAERTLQAARDRGVVSSTIDLDLLRYAFLLRRSNSAIDDAEAVLSDPNAAPGNVFFAAYHLLTLNRLDRAREGFRRVLDAKGYEALTRGNLAAADLVELYLAKGRPEVPGRVSTAQSSFLVREPSSDTLVVGFALPEGTLGMPLNAVQALLSSTGVNTLYLYDSRQLFHLSGTDRFGPGYQAMIDGVRALAAELGVRRIITMGGSGSGYTAIHAGIDMKADGIIAFAPQTIMLPRTNPGVARSAHTVRRLQQNVLPMMKDLRLYLDAQKDRPQIEIYYGASNRRDIMHVSNLAGASGVTLHAVQGLARHDALTEMAARGYRDLLRAFKKR